MAPRLALAALDRGEVTSQRIQGFAPLLRHGLPGTCAGVPGGLGTDSERRIGVPQTKGPVRYNGLAPLNRKAR
jgi:hypothetical protein